jgi:hypothetical protein
MVVFMQQGPTITSEVYCETLKKKLYRAIQNKRHGMLTSGVVLLHDNARLYTAPCTQALLKHFNWDVVSSPSLQPCFCSEQLPPVYLPEELVGKAARQQ